MGNSKATPFYFGGLASCMAAVVTHPLDLIKVRLQAYKGGDGKKPGMVKVRLAVDVAAACIACLTDCIDGDDACAQRGFHSPVRRVVGVAPAAGDVLDCALWSVRFSKGEPRLLRRVYERSFSSHPY